jgi:hypothetical protein
MENKQLRTLLDLGSVALIAILVVSFIYVIATALKSAH